MKKFTKPELNIVFLENDNIIVCSGGPTPSKQITKVDGGLDLGGNYDEEF